MQLIPLWGKHAVGTYRHTKVDDADFDRLIRTKWYAKPSGSLIYAARNVLIDGSSKTLRMHREVLGLSRDDPRDADHLNHDTVDNRRSNLEAVTRLENVRRQRERLVGVRKYCSEQCANSKPPLAQSMCWACEKEFQPAMRNQQYCCKVCNDKGTRPAYSKVYFNTCPVCRDSYVSRRTTQTYCSKYCKDASRYVVDRLGHQLSI